MQKNIIALLLIMVSVVGVQSGYGVSQSSNHYLSHEDHKQNFWSEYYVYITTNSVSYGSPSLAQVCFNNSGCSTGKVIGQKSTESRLVDASKFA